MATSAALATTGVALLLLAAHDHRPPSHPTAAAAGTVSLPRTMTRAGPRAPWPGSLQAPGSVAAQPPVAGSVLPPVAGSVLPARPLGPAVPLHLRIPALGVSAPVVGLGLNGDRTLQVPGDDTRTAWYRASPAPGAPGPAIVVGHVDSAVNGPAVFYRLAELVPGDLIDVARSDGRTAVFTVTGVREYAKDHFPTRLVYADTEDAALRLITCGGGFDRTHGSYRDDVVVFATLSGSETTSTAERRPALAG